jgi:GNAT superfamily N-acetyltransferase
MATPVIRAAAPEDVDHVVPMYEWLFAPPGVRPNAWDPDHAAAALAGAIAAERSVVLVATLGDEFVGVCTAYDDIDSVRFGRRVWVEDLAVDPDRRSLGIGKLLLDEAKDWGRARGATHLELDSAQTRADAHRFYEREQPSTHSTCFGWEL